MATRGKKLNSYVNDCKDRYDIGEGRIIIKYYSYDDDSHSNVIKVFDATKRTKANKSLLDLYVTDVSHVKDGFGNHVYSVVDINHADEANLCRSYMNHNQRTFELR